MRRAKCFPRDDGKETAKREMVETGLESTSAVGMDNCRAVLQAGDSRVVTSLQTLKSKSFIRWTVVSKTPRDISNEFRGD